MNDRARIVDRRDVLEGGLAIGTTVLSGGLTAEGADATTAAPCPPLRHSAAREEVGLDGDHGPLPAHALLTNEYDAVPANVGPDDPTRVALRHLVGFLKGHFNAKDAATRADG